MNEDKEIECESCGIFHYANDEWCSQKREEVECKSMLAKRNEVEALKKDRTILNKAETKATTEYWDKMEEWREANNELFVMENPSMAKRIEEVNKMEALWQKAKKDLKSNADYNGIEIPKYFLS